MKASLLAALLMSCVPMMAMADITASERDEKLQVLQLVKTYSETVACETTFEGDEPLAKQLVNVFTIERDVEGGLRSFYVLWGGDKGCNGGSGTSSFFISEVGRYSGSRPLLVMNDEAFGKAMATINPRFIVSLKQNSPSSFTLVSLEHDADDANNFPSKKYRYELRQQKGNWLMTQRSYLDKP